MLKLHHSPFSVSSQKVRIALAEKGLDWTDRVIDLLAGEHFGEDFRRLNPRAEVPVLEHDGHVLSESWLICEYLDEVFPHVVLIPDSAANRHAARLWDYWMEREIHAASGVLTYAILARPLLTQQTPETLDALLEQLPDSSVRAWRASVLERGLQAPEVKTSIESHRVFFRRMEAALRDAHGWLVGTSFSMADIAALPYVMRAEHLGLGSLMSFDDVPNLRSWYFRMLARPSMQPSFVRYLNGETQALLTQLVVAAQPELNGLIQLT
jgi:glutathione S-transferase